MFNKMPKPPGTSSTHPGETKFPQDTGDSKTNENSACLPVWLLSLPHWGVCIYIYFSFGARVCVCVCVVQAPPAVLAWSDAFEDRVLLRQEETLC